MECYGGKKGGKWRDVALRKYQDTERFLAEFFEDQSQKGSHCVLELKGMTRSVLFFQAHAVPMWWGQRPHRDHPRRTGQL